MSEEEPPAPLRRASTMLGATYPPFPASSVPTVLLLPEVALLPFSDEDSSRLTKRQLEHIPDPWSTRTTGLGKANNNKTLRVTDFAKTMKAAALRITLPESVENPVDDEDNSNDTFVDASTDLDQHGASDATENGHHDGDDKEGSMLPVLLSSPTLNSPNFNLTLLSAKVDLSRFQWAPLFAHMQLRKINRKIKGYAMDQSHDTPLILLSIVNLLLFSFYWLTATYESVQLSQKLGFGTWAWCLLGIVMLPGLIAVRFQVPPVVEWTWRFVAIAFICSLFVATDYAINFGNSVMPGNICYSESGVLPLDDPTCLDFLNKIDYRYLDARIAIEVIFAAFILGTWILFAFRNMILPWLVKRYRYSSKFLTWMFAVEQGNPDGGANPEKGTHTISYRLPFPWSWTRRRYIFKYRGSIAPDYQASGFGRVSDSASTGELLEGWFEDGIPVAPFRSSEKGRFNAWEGLRIGMAGATFDNWRSTGTKSDPKGLSWGVATTECTVAGRFFRNLPVRKKLLPRLVPPDTQTYLRDILLPTLSAGIPNVDVNKHAREAVIYVHGFKQSIASATTKLAQLAGLAALPNAKFAFWCFDWPSGSTFSFNRSRVESGSAETEQRFGEFLKALVDAGCRKVHIIGHSMGARVATNLAREGGKGFSEMFRRCDGVSRPGDENRAELSSFIMINPEVLLDDFVVNRFPGLRLYCSSITIYADRNDSALYTAETVGSGLTLGRNPHMIMVKDSQGRPRYLDLDCIDDTHLEQNVGAVRHSYFTINSMMVEDFAAQIVDGLKRAEDRPRLRRRAGNVWGFLVAPKAVVK